MRRLLLILSLIVGPGMFVSTLGAQSVGDLSGLLKTDRPIEATGYDSHVELRWQRVDGAEGYAVWLVEGESHSLRAETTDPYCLDFVDRDGPEATFTYRVAAIDSRGREISRTPEVTATVREFSDDELMRMVQQYTFRYFWDFADPISGLAFERSNDGRPNCVTTGGTGFGIGAIIAGVENGFVTRAEAVGHLLKIVGSLERFPRFHGAWAHWYDSAKNEPYHFSARDNGGDLVETAFLVQGLLAARGYFDGAARQEKELRERIEKLWREVEWNHYTQGSDDALYWHWSPDYGFEMNHRIRGYDECLVTYILAASSPTHPIPRSVYDRCWVNRTDGEFFCQTEFYDIMLPLGKRMQMGGPLFWVHYSFIGLCPRGLSDNYVDYWEQNRRYTLVNRAYCIDNPLGWPGYGEEFWGLTACDALPSGYRAHSPGPGNDRGTVAPTAALSSMPYTPAESMAVLKNLYRNLGRDTFGPMGFYDAVNLGMKDKKSTESYLAIDQGPIVAMIENHRSGAIWNAFMKNDDILRGLSRLGFRLGGQPIAINTQQP